MPILQMETTAVQAVNQQFSQQLATIEQQAITLNNSCQSLISVWEGTSAQQFQQEIQQLLDTFRRVCSDGETLNQRLQREIQQWEQTAATLGSSSAVVTGASIGVGVAVGGAAVGAGTPPPNTQPPISGSSPGSGSSGAPPTAPTQPPTSAPPPNIPDYDGQTPADGTFGMRPWHPTQLPLTSDPNNRSAELYTEVLDQFAVGDNVRYAQNQQGKGETYCNIFVWDATKAMGVEIPHWVDGNGNPTAVAATGSRELSANGVVGWLNQHGPSNGWRVVGAEEAQQLANQGKPTVAGWSNPRGIGHVAMVRPGEMGANGPRIAQAGGANFNDGNVRQGFSDRPVVYYVHD